MLSWVWKLLGVSEASPESRKKLGVVALLYFIQARQLRFLGKFCRCTFASTVFRCRRSAGCVSSSCPIRSKFSGRRWCIATATGELDRTCMLGIAAVLFGSAVCERRRGRRALFCCCILALTTLSATQDVAIDSYSVGFIRREEEGAANGVRASAYRVVLVCAGGGLVFLAAVLQWNSLLFWPASS